MVTVEDEVEELIEVEEEVEEIIVDLNTEPPVMSILQITNTGLMSLYFDQPLST